MGKKIEPITNPDGTVAPRIGADNYATLCRLAKKHKVKPNTLARQLLIFAVKELAEGKIELPPDHAIRA